jgi:hypothetical protein
MYFELDWKVSDTELSNTGRCDDPRVSWTMGVRWERPVAQPIRCELNPKRGPKLRDAYLINIPLFSRRLLDAIRSVGVDNLQTFDAELTDLSGQVHTDYKAVNIIGAISCADLEQSQFQQPEGYPFINFQRLVIDARKARGLDLFRLGEHPARIILSARAAMAVRALDPVGVALIAVETSN